jgi:hypothetical protein
MRRISSGDDGAPPSTIDLSDVRSRRSQLHEQDELIWNDGVAPEAALDFDAPHISKWQGLAMWLGGFTFFASVFAAAWSLDQPANKISGDRDLPEDGKAALGGYANGKW